MSLMISVITPSFNSERWLERAIASVKAQNYRRWEHIVVDGGSTDGTLKIVKRHGHLRWISEPDDGQVHAMHKGFAMAKGDVVVYLNADDYFLKKAFARAVKAFAPGIMMVVGKIRVDKGGASWINDPKIDLESMLRHWEMNAYCYNPVGYFIRRELQEQIPFNADNPDKHDLEFLLEVARRFPDAIVKIDRVLGVFSLTEASKTLKDQAQPGYWRPHNFPFVDRALAGASPEFQRIFPSLRSCGYQTQTRWAIRDAIRQGRAGEWARQGQLISLPVDGAEANGHMAFSEKLNHVIEGDTVVCVLSAAWDDGTHLAQALRTLPEHISAYPVYHVDLSAVDRPMAHFLENGQPLQDYMSCAGFRQAWKRYKDRLRWKFILPWTEPVAMALAAEALDPVGDAGLDSRVQVGWKGIEDKLTRVFLHLTGLDLLTAKVEGREAAALVRDKNAEILVCQEGGSQNSVRTSFVEFLGIPWPDGFDDSKKGLTLSMTGRIGKGSAALQAPLVGPRILDAVYESPLVRRFMTSKDIMAGRSRLLDPDAVVRCMAAAPAINLAPYQLEFVTKILQHTGLAGKRILEIGSDSDLCVGRALARLGAAHMQCSNMVDFSDAMENCDSDRMSFAHCDGRELLFEDASFDLVVGCALLEHVRGVDAFARELYRVAKPGGHVFLHGAPMWPSHSGHHVYFIGKARFYKFTDDSNPVPDYGHLTLTPAQMAQVVATPDIPQEDREGIVHYAYEDEVLNRLHPDVIVGAFADAFEVVEDLRLPNTPFPEGVSKGILDPAIASGKEIYTLELFLKKPD